MSEPLLFERSATQFFAQEETKESLVALARSDRIILYCGAGVTIDRTGLGWKDLISLSLRAKVDDSAHYISDRHLGILSDKLDSQRLASVLSQHFVSKYSDPETRRSRIIGNLRQELYERHTWRGGRLAGNIVQFAIFAASAGKEVSIVTTNYDTYIEQEIDAELSRLRNTKEPYPGLVVETTYRRSVRDRKPSDVTLPTVHLVYLHGRIPQESKATERVVIDEVDYAITRARSVEALTALFGAQTSTIIMVGASLTDPPLLEALALTRDSGAHKFALMPVSSTQIGQNPESDVDDLLKHLRGRCRLLGFDLLTPDFKTQVAQFFEELTICSGLVDPAAYLKKAERVSYGQRLVQWWEDWSPASKEEPYIVDTFTELRAFTGHLREEWKLPSEATSGAELLKIEMWVRWAPAEHRSLALWASSLGVLVARDLLRRAELVIDAPQASARCFTEGRPQHVDLSEVQPPKTTHSNRPYPTRWTSFLSVPIYLESPTRRLVAGVITLASSKSKEESKVPRMETGDMEDLITRLRALGTKILQPKEPAETAADS